MNNPSQNYWKKCSSCKKELPFSTMYYVCSVSTCRHKRKGFQFCSVPCWDAHLGFMNHREAWAEERTSPSKDQYEASLDTGASSKTTERQPMRKVVQPASSQGNQSQSSSPQSSASQSTPAELKASQIKTDTLVVVSKVKNLIKEQSGFSTSQCCVDALTRKVVAECLKGIEYAKKAERKTVMGRDIR